MGAICERKSKESWREDYSDSFSTYFTPWIFPFPRLIRYGLDPTGGSDYDYAISERTCIMHWAAYPGVTCSICSRKAQLAKFTHLYHIIGWSTGFWDGIFPSRLLLAFYTNVLKYYARGGILCFQIRPPVTGMGWDGVYSAACAKQAGIFTSLNDDDEDGYGYGRIIVLTYCTFSGSNTSDLRFSDDRERRI